jgi:membrane fusion protein (multidrug efflux system)
MDCRRTRFAATIDRVQKTAGRPRGRHAAGPSHRRRGQTSAVTESLSLVGSIAANEMVEIKSETEGIIQEILFNEGQPVEKGQLLVRLDDTKLAAAVAEAESSFKLSGANFERAKELLKGTLISSRNLTRHPPRLT